MYIEKIAYLELVYHFSTNQKSLKRCTKVCNIIFNLYCCILL